MRKQEPLPLSRRERQIMEIIYAQGQASVSEVQARLPDPPGYSAVRTLLNILEKKGYLRHAQDGAHYVYSPTTPRDDVGPTALTRVMDTFFGGSVEQTVAALLEVSADELTTETIDQLAQLIEQARKEGR